MGLFNGSKSEETKPEVDVQEETQVIEEEAPAAGKLYVDEMGIIAPATTIYGGIITKGHLAVAGSVESTVKVEGNIMLSGSIKGSIECNNIIIDGAHIDCNGAIKAKGSVSVKEGSSFKGNISCKHISITGTVIGNISASGNVGLTKTAVVRGDISASVLAVEPGAKIAGKVMIE